MRGIVIGVVRIYQKTLSPQRGLFKFIYLLPIFNLYGSTRPGCRFQPSCSEYCILAVGCHGVVMGLWLSAKRLARCR